MNPVPLPERDHTPPADLVAILTEIVDATMPGRRIGSAPPEDCAPAALALLESVRPSVLPDHLGLSSVHAWLAQHGQRTDERFARAFRRQAILARMRAASPLDPPPEPVLMPQPQPAPGYACPNGCGCALAHPAEPCPCCDVDGAVLLVSDEGEHNSADALPPCPCRAAQNCHPQCPCPCHRQSGLPGAPLPLTPAALAADAPPFDCLSLLGQNADLRRRLALIASLTAKLPGTWPELFAVLRTIKAIAA